MGYLCIAVLLLKICISHLHLYYINGFLTANKITWVKSMSELDFLVWLFCFSITTQPTVLVLQLGTYLINNYSSLRSNIVSRKDACKDLLLRCTL